MLVAGRCMDDDELPASAAAPHHRIAADRSPLLVVVLVHQFVIYPSIPDVALTRCDTIAASGLSSRLWRGNVFINYFTVSIQFNPLKSSSYDENVKC